MELNNQNNPLPPINSELPTPSTPVPMPPVSKKWYQHKSITTIVILAFLVAIISWIYFAKEPAQNTAPILVNHKTNQSPQPVATTLVQSIATSSPSQIDLINWKTYTDSQYKYQIMYPPDWPISLAGNILTIGNTGTPSSACYLTITFNGSGGIIAAPKTYNYADGAADAQKCSDTLNAIASSGKFSSQVFQWPSSYQVVVKKTSTDLKTGATNLDASFRYTIDGLKAKDEDLESSTSSITISRLDLGKIYDLLPTTQSYVISPVPSSTTAVTQPFDTTGFWENQGSEIVSGQPANKYAVYSSPPTKNGGQISHAPFYVWLSALDNTPIQAEFPSGVTMYFSNYSTSPIPASEFEIPNGYTKF